MSHIVVYLKEFPSRADAATQLEKTLGSNADTLRNAVAAGKPVVELELFDDDYDDHVALLKRLVKVLDKHKIPSRIYELPEGETMETCSFADNCLITTKVLSNILAD